MATLTVTDDFREMLKHEGGWLLTYDVTKNKEQIMSQQFFVRQEKGCIEPRGHLLSLQRQKKVVKSSKASNLKRPKWRGCFFFDENNLY